MTLDEAIKHAEEVAKQNEEDAVIYSNCKNHKKNLYEIGLAENAEKKCCKCAEEHRRLAEWLKELKRLREQTRWIPCSPETMPKTEERVLVTCEHLNCYGKPYRYICKAFHVDRYTMESTGDWDEGCDEYREEDDKFYVLEGWYEVIHNWGDYGAVRISEDKVVAWCELPTPYREGKQDERSD